MHRFTPPFVLLLLAACSGGTSQYPIGGDGGAGSGGGGGSGGGTGPSSAAAFAGHWTCQTQANVGGTASTNTSNVTIVANPDGTISVSTGGSSGGGCALPSEWPVNGSTASISNVTCTQGTSTTTLVNATIQVNGATLNVSETVSSSGSGTFTVTGTCTKS